jgi:hypothetical protein
VVIERLEHPLPARLPDAYRQAGMRAGLDYLDEHQTNAIAKSYMVGALLAALTAFEEEWARDSSSRQGYALVYEGRPIATLPTKSMARQQRRLYARHWGLRQHHIRIVETEYVV